MGKSYRHNPITGMTTARSEKKDKRLVNKKLRHIVNSNLKKLVEEVENVPSEYTDIVNDNSTELLIDKEDISNVWDFNKDGKQRFDPKKYPKLMRK